MCEREIACGRERKVKRLETDRHTQTETERQRDGESKCMWSQWKRLGGQGQ